MGWGLVMVAWGAAEDSWKIATGGLKPTVENPHRACTSDKTEEVRAFKSTLTCSSACACRLDLSPPAAAASERSACELSSESG